MTKQIRPLTFVSITTIALIATILFFANITHANPSFFSPQAKLALSTTTPIYQTPGTATTSLVFDSYGINGTNENGGALTSPADSAELLVQLSASTTLVKENINIEYSDDNIDWYQASPGMPLGYASTTLPISLLQVPQYQMSVASTTAGLGVATTSANAFFNARDTRAIEIKTPTRYVRAIFTCAVGGVTQNCAVWGQFVPKKQNP